MKSSELLLLLTSFIILGVVGLVAAHHKRKQRNTWEMVAEGIFDHATYGGFEYETRSGAMVHTTTYHREHKTAIYLSDGRSYVAAGLLDMPAKGTFIKIWRNGLGENKIE